MWHLLARPIGDEDRAAPGALLSPTRQHGVLSRLDLAAVEEPDGTTHQEKVALAKLPFEPGLPRPGGGDQAGIVLQYRLEDAKPRPRGDDAAAPHAPHDVDLHPHLERPDRGHGRRVVVPARRMVQKVSSGPDTEPTERVRAPGADSLEELHGSIQRREPHRIRDRIRPRRRHPRRSPVGRRSPPPSPPA